ncbi:MAG TPA: type V toxin-antitoxin system endoribonuclease antitoxin GhoS [Terracidiphilus sp.]|jgi:hypothetical protein
MNQFTVRIELHEAQWADYNTLHAAMERQGFSRLITGDDGRAYQLPWAEYYGTANLSSIEIRDIAHNVANTTGKTNSVLVTEGTSLAWWGLTIARN